MERNPNDLTDNASRDAMEAEGGPADGGTLTHGSTSGSGVADRTREVAGSAHSKLADVGSTIREKTGSAKDSLADALESGAEKLRQRAHNGQMAGATSVGSVSVDGDNRLGQLSDKLAGGMDTTAEFLRDADLDSIKRGVERQVREHPGRTLLIAAGVGYLLGRAFRSKS